jgi:hypothetical protein
MNTKQRDKILKLARKMYEFVGCNFPEDNREMIEYLNDSQHPDEQRCLQIALEAHNVYCEDNLCDSDFFDWHGI